MKIIGRLVGFIVFIIVGYILVSYLLHQIKDMHNPIMRIGLLCLLFVCCIIIFFIWIDVNFKTHIAEKIIATLVSNLLWELIKFVGRLFLQGYKLSSTGVIYGAKVLKRIFARIK